MPCQYHTSTTLIAFYPFIIATQELETQNMRVNKQREHLESARAQVEEELLTQQTHMAELDERLQKTIEKHRAKV